MVNLSSSIRHASRRVTAILFVAAAIIPGGQCASWTEINSGLPGIKVGVNSLAIDPASPSTLYAQTVSNSQGSTVAQGLYKTTDGGESWTAIGSVSGVQCLAIDPTNPATIYAGTGQGVVKSTNGGQSWTDVSSTLPAGAVNRLVIDPMAPSTLYAVTSTAPVSFPGGPIYSAIYKTTDSGASWSALNTGLPPGAYITVLVIDPSTPSTIYTFAPAFDPTGTGATPVGGLLKSVDGGQNWTPLNGLLFVSSLAIDPVNPSTLYVTGAMGLLKSVDGGQSWNALNGNLPPNTNVNLVVIDRVVPSAIFAVSTTFGPTGQSSGILKSTDGGATWNTFNIGIPSNTLISSLVVDPMSPSRIYAGASGILFGPPGVPGGGASGGVFKTTDGGETWNAASAGLISFDVRTLAINPVNPVTLYAGGYGGTSKSTDGATWSATGLGSYTGSLVADSTDPNVLYALTGSSFGCNSSDSLLFSSTDGGANWSNTLSPLNSGCILNAGFSVAHATPVAIDPSDPNTLYLGESDDQDGYSAILKSTDRGANWRAAWDWFNGLRAGVRALAIDPAHSAALYAGLDDGTAALGSLQAMPDSTGLFRSTDGGKSWSNTGLTTSAVNLLTIDPANSQIIYAGTEGHYGQPAGFQGLFKSTDGGRTWTAINNGLAGLIGVRSTTASTLLLDPADSRVLYLGTSSSGVFRSPDGGASWSPFNEGLTSLQIRAVTVAPGPAHTVYAATSDGVFKYSDQ